MLSSTKPLKTIVKLSASLILAVFMAITLFYLSFFAHELSHAFTSLIISIISLKPHIPSIAAWEPFGILAVPISVNTMQATGIAEYLIRISGSVGQFAFLMYFVLIGINQKSLKKHKIILGVMGSLFAITQVYNNTAACERATDKILSDISLPCLPEAMINFAFFLFIVFWTIVFFEETSKFVEKRLIFKKKTRKITLCKHP